MDTDPVDVANQNRVVAGRHEISTDSEKSRIMHYRYNAILDDEERTSAEFESTEIHQVGDRIVHPQLNIPGKITRVERVF